MKPYRWEEHEVAVPVYRLQAGRAFVTTAARETEAKIGADGKLGIVERG